MRDDVCNVVERFARCIPDTRNTPYNVALIEEYLSEFPREAVIHTMTDGVPRLFHRQWIRASIRGHLRKTAIALRLLKRGNVVRARHILHIADLYLKQACTLHRVTMRFKKITQRELASLRIDMNSLEDGDVVLSYKTRKYLKKSTLSWCVKFASNSPVTHALIACVDKNSPRLLVSGDTTSGLGEVPATPNPGEIFIVMKIQDMEIRNHVKKVVAKWLHTAQARTYDRMVRAQYSFPEIKVQLASFIGLFIVPLVYLGVPLSVPNPARRMHGVFCSELIDTIFKETNALLTPRCEHDAVVAPIEFLYSPLLEFKGILVRDEDLVLAYDEVRNQFSKKGHLR